MDEDLSPMKEDVKREFQRQSQYLVNVSKSLRSEVSKAIENHKTDQLDRILENESAIR